MQFVPGNHYRNAYYTGFFVFVGKSERGFEFDHFDHGDEPVRIFFSEMIAGWSYR